ncbi:MAG: CDP-glycerol glycerophosphotransferase family protein [Eubacteriales bacterium]|nr:CDP-glycerol glycerophosphotransferase family protein [Eubacteriales bacterium]
MMNMKQKIRTIVRDIYKTWTLHCLYPSAYKKYTKRPVDKTKIVFLEVRMPRLTNNFLPLYRSLEERKQYHLEVCYIREGMDSHIRVMKNSLAALKEMADARYILVNDSSHLLGCLPLRKETTVIQTWHACGAFKKFGYSFADTKDGSARKDLERFPFHKNFSYVTVSSREVVWAYAEAFHMEKESEKILPIGISRTDCFFREEDRREAYNKLYKVMPASKGKKIVLYAPTFRGKVADAFSPDRLDFKKMHEALGNDTVFLCKHHFLVKKRPGLPEECREYAMDVTECMTIEELLMVSDVCISDYSSLIFEYSLFERPMVFFAYDLEAYYDARGFYYPFAEMAPGPVLKTTEEVIEYLQNLDQRFDREQVRRFRQKFMSACDGHATERLLELIERNL